MDNAAGPGTAILESSIDETGKAQRTKVLRDVEIKSERF